MDSTGIRFGQNFWLIGGLRTCGAKSSFMPQFERNEYSYIWNTYKKRWTQGPKYYHLMKYTFHYACPIALNTTAVLFIGLFYVDTEATDFQYPKPKHTMIYNFETKTWTKQQSLDFGNEKFLIGYDQNMACTTEQKKDFNR